MATAGALVTVENGNWGATSLRAIHAALASAAAVLTEAFGRLPDAPIRVASWSMDPQVFHDQRPYQIRLSARDRYWSQYVYQFSHELCHVLTGFDAHKEHKHRWFEESLCALASLFVLHRLAAVWAEAPPAGIVDAAGFAPNHGTYARTIAGRYPRIGQAGARHWFSAHVSALETDRYERDLTGAVAVLLLDRFRAEPALWRDCAHLNRWNPADDPAFAHYLASWTAHLREHGVEARAPAVIGAALGVDPGRVPTRPGPRER